MKIHFSIDDVITSLVWLDANNAGTIFESYTFSLARELYVKYGVTTTCNCLFSDGVHCLQDIPDKWKDEFVNSSCWLKFAFHGYDFDTDYTCREYADASNDYSLIRNEIIRICGDKTFTDWTRIHLFSGGSEAIKAWRDNGLKGLFTADDKRKSYDLSAKEEELLKDIYRRAADGVSFVKTDIRIEHYGKEELLDFLKHSTKEQLVVFTHENQLPLSDTIDKIRLIMDYYQKDAIEELI